MTLRSMYLWTRSTPIISYNASYNGRRYGSTSGEVARQEAELFAGFHCRTHEQNPADALLLERGDRAGDRQIGLAGAGRPDAEVGIVQLDG